MENFNIKYILLVFLGMIIHVLMNVVSRSSKSKDKMSLKVFFKDRMNLVRISLSIFSAIALLIMLDELADMFGITLSDGSVAKTVFAFFIGYFNHSLIRDVLKIFKNRK